jgi:phage host-nuclease inhibitor protein Gam
MKIDKEVLVGSIQSEIITRLRSIKAQQEEKKAVAARYNETISVLEKEIHSLLEQLEDIHRLELTVEADKILEDENGKD